MRTFIFLLCTTVFGLSSDGVFSQNTKVVIDADKVVTVDEVFEIIKAQSDYRFVYRSQMFKDFPKVQLNKGTIGVRELLEKSFNTGDFDFEFISEHNIVIKEKPVQPQQIVVTGKVTDISGVPLPGVNVVTEDRSSGVATDFEGNFKIPVANASAVLVFTYVGFAEKKLSLSTLSDYNNLTVVLDESVNTLDEVLITGYQELSQERTAGSFAQADALQLQQRPSSPNIIDRLTGQVSGLNVNPAFNSFEIRGRSTIFSGQANPLIVVDGFPLADQQNYESINPEDVESVTVLKDASASSIWGARASNGVVVIVTKKGNKNQKLSVDFSSFVELEDKVDLNDFDWMSTAEEIDLDNEFIDKGWTNLTSIANSVGSINDLHLAHIYKNGLSPDGNIWSQDRFNAYVDELKTRDVTNDWEKYLLRNALRTTYNLSISGGGDRNSVFASLSYTDKQEQSVGAENDRISMNIRNIFEYNDKVTFTAGLTAVLRNQTENVLETQYGTAAASNVAVAALAQPYDQLVDSNGQYVQKYFSWNPWVSQDREAFMGVPYTFNFLEEQRNKDVGSTLMDVRADFKLDIELVKDLMLSSSFRYERNTNDYDNYKTMSAPSWRNTVNDYYVYNASLGSYVNGIPLGANYLMERSYSKGWVFKNTLTWDTSWADHDLTVFAGAEYSRRYSETMLNRQFGYDKQTTNYVPINEVDLLGRRILNWNGQAFSTYYNGNQIFDISNTDNRFVSVFSNLGYTYKNKYTINGSFRIDQANIYGSNPDFRYKPLWSAGVAWNMEHEAFLENVSWLNRLKLRATYGLGGNTINNASPYPTAYNRNITWGNPYVSLVLSQPGNPDLKWEETATTDFGVDFALFNDRLSGSLDYYYKKSTDVYSRQSLDPTVGFANSVVNYADIDNKGWELVLNADIIRGKDFNWSVRTNFNINKNELIEYDTGYAPTADSYTGANAYVVGKPIGAMYSYKFAGLDANGEVLLYDTDGNTKSWSQNVEVDELKYEGARTPTNYGGLSTTLKYKGLDFTVNMNYQAGFVFRRSYNYASTGQGTANNMDYDFSNIRVHEVWADRWMQPGDEANTMVPKIFYNGLNPNTGMVENRYNTSTMHRIWNQSTYNVHKGDYIRVQDIILGYSMPSQFLDATFFKSLRFTMQVSNPFIWVANDLGVDPLVPDSDAYLNLTRYTLGLRATF